MQGFKIKLFFLFMGLSIGYFRSECLGQKRGYHVAIETEQARYPNSEVVYLLDEGKIELKENGTARGKFHLKLKILNERGLDHKELQILGGKSKKVVTFKGKVIKPDGEERQVKADEILETSYSSKNKVYQDVQVKSIRFREVSVGCVLDYEYEVDYGSFVDLPSWVFDGSHPVERSNFSIQFPAEVKLFYSNLDTIPAIKFQKSLKDGDSLFVWTAENLPPILIEPNMPSLNSLQRRVLFWTPNIRFQGKRVSFASWQSVVNWYLDRLEGKLNLDSKIFDKIPAYSLARNDEEKAKVIYQFVQDGFRYIDIEFGEGYYEPNDSKTIMRRRYGDVKDFVVVLTALLRSANIESYPALLRSRDFGPVVKEIVTLQQFDRMIVAAIIDGDTLYLDPTDLVCPFKMLPPSAQASKVLILKRDHVLWQMTPTFSAALSDFRNIYQVNFDPMGAIIVSGTIYAGGLVGDVFRTLVKVATRKEMRRLVEDYFNSWVPGIKLLEQDFASTYLQTQKQDTSQTHFEGRFTFQCDHYYSSEDSLIFFNLNLLNKTQLPSFAIHPYDERIHPVVFGNKFVNFDRVGIQIPKGFEVLFIPNDVELEKKFASLRISYKKTENSIVVIRWFELKALRIEKKSYDDLREFYIRTAQADQAKIIFNKLPAR